MTTPTQRSLNPNLIVNDVWRLVFSYLNPHELRVAARTCTHFNQIINKDSWRDHCQKIFTATLLPENTDWKSLAFHYLFWAIKHDCFITQYVNNRLGIKLNLFALGAQKSKINLEREKDLYLLVYPTSKFNPVEIAKHTTNHNYQNSFIRGSTSSSQYSTLIFFKEDVAKVLAAFFQAAKMMKLFHNPLRDYIIKVEARGLKPSIGCSMAAEAAELRRVSCVTPPVP